MIIRSSLDRPSIKLIDRERDQNDNLRHIKSLSVQSLMIGIASDNQFELWEIEEREENGRAKSSEIFC